MCNNTRVGYPRNCSFVYSIIILFKIELGSHARASGVIYQTWFGYSFAHHVKPPGPGSNRRFPIDSCPATVEPSDTAALATKKINVRNLYGGHLLVTVLSRSD